MIALLISLLRGADYERRQIKLALSVLVWDLAALIIVETIIVALVQTLFYPVAAIIGLLWVLLTAGIIWHLGGPIVDSGFLARIIGLSVGQKFTNALNIFFFIHTAIVTFFLVVPIWAFWTGYFILIIALIGLTTSGILAGRKWDWKIAWSVYAVLTALMLCLIFLFAGYNFFASQGINSGLVKDGLNKATNLPLLTNASPKQIFSAIGVLILALIFLWLVFPKGKIKRALKIIALAAITMFMVTGLLWSIFTTTPFDDRTKAAVAGPPAPTYVPPAPDRFPRLIDVEPCEVEIRPDKLSALYQRIEPSTVCYDTGAIKAHDIMVYDAISGAYLCRFSEIKVSQLRKGVRFIGPAGTIKRTG